MRLGNQSINSTSIRNITYTIIREELARLYGISVQEAADIIGTNLTVRHTKTSLAISLWYPTGRINGSDIMGMCQGC